MVFLVSTQAFQQAQQFLPIRALGQAAEEALRLLFFHDQSKDGLFSLGKLVGEVREGKREIQLRQPVVGQAIHEANQRQEVLQLVQGELIVKMLGLGIGAGLGCGRQSSEGHLLLCYG